MKAGFLLQGDFKYLDSLRTLKMSHLPKCTKVERGAFANIKALKVFEMIDLPKVMFMDVKVKHTLYTYSHREKL